MEQLQEVAAQGVLVADAVDAHAVMAEAVPVTHDRREDGQEPVGLVALGIEGELGLEGSEHGAARAHHVHRVSVARDALQYFFQRLRQVAQAFELVLVVGKLGLAGQLAIQQQVSHLLEFGMGGQVTDIIAPIGQPSAGLTDRRQGRLPGNLTAQACAAEYFCFGHGASPFLNLLWNAGWLTLTYP